MKQNPSNKKRAGIGTSIVGIICNLVLSIAKITIGLMSGLVSVVADGFNNLSDMGSSTVSLISFYISEKPADEKHPHGHHRAEYVATMTIGFLILLVAFEFFKESIDKIIEGTLPEVSILIYVILSISIVVKAAMFVFYQIMAKKLNSETLKAASIDSICDCFTTLAVIIGAIIAQFAGKPADGWIGIIVSLFIAWQSIKILHEQASKLIGQAVDPALVAKIKEYILSNENILDLHDLRVFSFGENKYFAIVHISISSDIPSLESHAILDKIENEVLEKYGVDLTAHLDPIDLHDSEAQILEEKIYNSILELEDTIEIHDFRIIRSSIPKIVFDVGVSYDCKQTDEELKEKITIKVAELCKYKPIITIDRE